MYFYNVEIVSTYTHKQLLTLDEYIWEVLFNEEDSWHPYHDDFNCIAGLLLYHYWLFLGENEQYYSLYWDLMEQIASQRGIDPAKLTDVLDMTRLIQLRADLEAHSWHASPIMAFFG